MANENGARQVSLEPKARDTGGKPVATPRSASLPVTGSFSQSSDSREYYDGSVPFLLAQGGVSRILTYSTC
jgi:hypothetical protein